MVKVRSKVLMPRLGLSTVIQLAQGTGGHGWSMVVKGWSRVVAGGRGWSMVVNLRSKVDWTWVVYSDPKGSRLFKC